MTKPNDDDKLEVLNILAISPKGDTSHDEIARYFSKGDGVLLSNALGEMLVEGSIYYRNGGYHPRRNGL